MATFSPAGRFFDLDHFGEELPLAAEQRPRRDRQVRSEILLLGASPAKASGLPALEGRAATAVVNGRTSASSSSKGRCPTPHSASQFQHHCSPVGSRSAP